MHLPPPPTVLDDNELGGDRLKHENCCTAARLGVKFDLERGFVGKTLLLVVVSPNNVLQSILRLSRIQQYMVKWFKRSRATHYTE